MNILINSLGIQDSGGITVLHKLLSEIEKSHHNYFIICSQNINIKKVIEKYKTIKNTKFIMISSKGFIYRLYYENIVFNKIIKEKKIALVYNFSGSAQFFSKVPQITKVHNLLFYSKKIEEVYFQKKEFLAWFKQIYLKRLIFHSMINQSNYIEIQSDHVRGYMSDFIDISKKQFFVKSDIEIKEESFKKQKKYNFSEKLRFLYIVGPHFEHLHKNFEDFVKTMKNLKKDDINFEVVVTLTEEQLHKSPIWDRSLDDKTMFLGYISRSELKKHFKENTILVSTSVIETLGLHVIEAIQNGIVVIVPNEKYSLEVYGNDILTYSLFNSNSLVKAINNLISSPFNEINLKLLKNQKHLIKNESMKYKSIVNIFDQIKKDRNV